MSLRIITNQWTCLVMPITLLFCFNSMYATYSDVFCTGRIYLTVLCVLWYVQTNFTWDSLEVMYFLFVEACIVLTLKVLNF